MLWWPQSLLAAAAAVHTHWVEKEGAVGGWGRKNSLGKAKGHILPIMAFREPEEFSSIGVEEVPIAQW